MPELTLELEKLGGLSIGRQPGEGVRLSFGGMVADVLLTEIRGPHGGVRLLITASREIKVDRFTVDNFKNLSEGR